MYEKKLFVIIVNLIIANSGITQTPPAIQWQNTIGGSGTDIIRSILQTSDGGFILAGYSSSDISGDKTENSIDSTDYWMVKTDDTGNIQWQNTIGGNDDDLLMSIFQTADDGFLLGGYSESDLSGDKAENSNGGDDYWIVKTDENGNIQWQNTIGGNEDDRLRAILQTTDGGFILAGVSVSAISGDKTEDSNGGYDYWIIKTDQIGNIIWQNTIGGNEDDWLSSILQTADGGFLLGGSSESGISGDKTEESRGGMDYWIVKTDDMGVIEWQHTIGGDEDDWLSSILQTADSGFMLGGYSYSDISGEKTEDNFAGEDYWIVKTDGSGAIQWQHTIGANGIDQLYSIRQTTDGGFIMGGFSNSNISGDKTENTNGGFDYWIVKTDIIGNILWENNIGGANFDMFIDLQQTADGGYILAGRSSSNISGDKTENSNGGWDYWIVKLAPESTTPAAILPDFFPKITISPNPASTQLTFSCHTAPVLELDIVNVMGEKVETVLVGNQLESRIIDISRLPAGVYFALIKTTVGHSTIRFAKVE